MFSSSKFLRKNFFLMYKGFISVQHCCLINLKSAKVIITKTLTRLKALGLKTVAVWSQTGKQTTVSALEQSHPSDGWTRWLRLLAASTVRLLSAAAFQWSPYKLWVLQRVWQVATEGVIITQSSASQDPAPPWNGASHNFCQQQEN